MASCAVLFCPYGRFYRIYKRERVEGKRRHGLLAQVVRDSPGAPEHKLVELPAKTESVCRGTIMGTRHY